MGVSLAPMSRFGLGKDANGFDSRMLRELKSKFIGRFFNLAIDYHAEKLGVTKFFTSLTRDEHIHRSRSKTNIHWWRKERQ
jgi:hypothetical protein